jgi:hypothetical protein
VLDNILLRPDFGCANREGCDEDWRSPELTSVLESHVDIGSLHRSSLGVGGVLIVIVYRMFFI